MDALKRHITTQMDAVKKDQASCPDAIARLHTKLDALTGHSTCHSPHREEDGVHPRKKTLASRLFGDKENHSEGKDAHLKRYVF